MPDLEESDKEFDPGGAANTALVGDMHDLSSIHRKLLGTPLSPPTICTERQGESNNSRRHRDHPLPVPVDDPIEYKGSRSVKRRLLRSSHVSGIVRDFIVALNSLCVGSDSAGRTYPQPLSAAQADVMASLNLSAQRLGSPPDGLNGEEP